MNEMRRRADLVPLQLQRCDCAVQVCDLVSAGEASTSPDRHVFDVAVVAAACFGCRLRWASAREKVLELCWSEVGARGPPADRGAFDAAVDVRIRRHNLTPEMPMALTQRMLAVAEQASRSLRVQLPVLMVGSEGRQGPANRRERQRESRCLTARVADM